MVAGVLGWNSSFTSAAPTGHWSVPLHKLSAFLGLITAVAAAILANTPGMIYGGLLCISNTLAAYNVYKLSAYQNIDRQNQKIAKTNEKIVESASALKKQSEEEAIATAELEKVKNEGERVIKEGGIEFAKLKDELNKTLAKLQQAEESLRQYLPLKDLVIQVNKLLEERVTIGEQNLAVKKQEEEGIEQEEKEIALLCQQLESRVQKFLKAYAQMSKEIQDLHILIKEENEGNAKEAESAKIPLELMEKQLKVQQLLANNIAQLQSLAIGNSNKKFSSTLEAILNVLERIHG